MDTLDRREEVQTGDGPMDVFTYRPTKDGPYPAVLVIQEIFGVNNHIQAVARRLAGDGYVTAAPDLFHRSGRNLTFPYTDFAPGRAEAMKLTESGLREDLQVTIDCLGAQPWVDADRMGIVGFCMGGRLAFLASYLFPSLRAAGVFYGGGICAPSPGAPSPIEQAQDIQCPIISFWGALDAHIPIPLVREIEKKVLDVGKSMEVNIYDQADHGFVCDERSTYNQEAAEDAWGKLLQFFSRHLGK